MEDEPEAGLDLRNRLPTNFLAVRELAVGFALIPEEEGEGDGDWEWEWGMLEASVEALSAVVLVAAGLPCPILCKVGIAILFVSEGLVEDPTFCLESMLTLEMLIPTPAPALPNSLELELLTASPPVMELELGISLGAGWIRAVDEDPILEMVSSDGADLFICSSRGRERDGAG